MHVVKTQKKRKRGSLVHLSCDVHQVQSPQTNQAKSLIQTSWLTEYYMVIWNHAEPLWHKLKSIISLVYSRILRYLAPICVREECSRLCRPSQTEYGPIVPNFSFLTAGWAVWARLLAVVDTLVFFVPTSQSTEAWRKNTCKEINELRHYSRTFPVTGNSDQSFKFKYLSLSLDSLISTTWVQNSSKQAH